MPLKTDQRIERLQTRLRETAFWRARETREIGDWRCDGEPIALGAPWPSSDGVLRFAAEASVPDDWPLEETRLSLDLGGESLLTLEYEGGARVELRPRRQPSGVSPRRPPFCDRQRERRPPPVRPAGRAIRGCSARSSSGSTSTLGRFADRLAVVVEAARDARRARSRAASGRGGGSGAAGDRLALDHRRLYRPRRARAGASRPCGGCPRPSPIPRRSAMPSARRSRPRTPRCARGSPRFSAAFRRRAKWR